MSGLTSAFMFGGHFSHPISCITAHDSTVITGSSTGEIVYWKMHDNFTPGVFCALPSDSACLQVCVIPASSEISALCGTPWVVVSLHEKCKIRTWDFNDGKCLTYSTDLFAETNSLVLLTTAVEDYVLTAGDTEIFMIDVYKMQKVKYFCTERKILALCCHENRLIIQSIGKIYIYNLQSKQKNPLVTAIENWVNIQEKTFIRAEKNIVLLSNSLDLNIILKDDKDTYSCQKYKISSTIRYLSISDSQVIICLDEFIKIYNLDDFINYHQDNKYQFNPYRISTELKPICCGNTENYLIMSDGKDLMTFSLDSKLIEHHKWTVENYNFPFLDQGEKITAYNLCVAEDVLIGMGTNTGRAILTTVAFSSISIFCYKKCEITSIYLHNNILAVGYKDETLAFWAYNSSQGTNFYNAPIKTIEVWAGPIRTMLPIKYSKRNSSYLNHMSWRTTKTLWKNTILAQCKSGAIMLTCFDKLEIMSYFQAIKSSIIKATIFLNLEYMSISCVNGHIYLFNMTVLTLEREIVGDEVLDFDSGEYIDDKLSKSIDRNDSFTACYEFYYTEPVRKLYEIKYINIGHVSFPVLHIDLAKVKHKPDMLSHVIPIINSDILRKGVYSKSKAFAFKNNWVSSLYLNSIHIISLFILNLSLPEHQCCAFALIVCALSQASNLRKKLLDLVQLTSQALKMCENILKPHSRQTRHAKRSLKHSYSVNFSSQKYHSQRIFVSIPEAIAITALSCACIKEQIPKSNSIVEHLVTMVKSSDEGYVLLSCELLARGISVLGDIFEDSQVEELVKELTLYNCKGYKSVSKDYFYEVTITIGLVSINIFIKTLKNELKNADVNDKYQKEVFNTIEYFIMHYILEATSVLEELGDFMLNACEIKNDIGDKNFSQDFNTALQTFIDFLPMTTLSHDSKILVVGLATGWLQVYDLKACKRWKAIKVFDTTISAIGIRDNYIACYSSQESSVKTVKIEQNFLGSIIGNSELKLTEKLLLGEIEPIASSYQELIKMTKLKWVDIKTLSIVRENKKEYLYLVKKFN